MKEATCSFRLNSVTRKPVIASVYALFMTINAAEHTISSNDCSHGSAETAGAKHHNLLLLAAMSI